MAKKTQNARPAAHRKALRAAATLATIGVVAWIIGFIGILASWPGVAIAATVVGVTMVLLSPVWYFTRLEQLQPDLYQHDQP